MKRFLATIIAAVFAVQAFAGPTIKCQAPNLVALDEQFNVTFVISGEASASDFNWTPGSDFKLVWGPQKGTSTSISIINGQRSKTSQSTYTYVLMPTAAGKFTFAPATARVDGETVSSAPHTIEVVSGGASAQQQGGQGGSAQPQQQSQQPSRQTGTVDGGDLFMRLILSKTNAVVGETISATLKLYQRVNIAGFEDAKFPTFNGFWSQEVQAPSNIEFHRENVNDAIYNAAVLRSWNLIPQQAGDIRIDPAELVCLVNIRAPRSSTGSIFDSFFQDEYQTVRKRIATSGFTVHIRPVPAGAPASFCGGVGKFQMSARLTRDSLQAHDAASLRITVTGKGNIALLSAPDINFPPDFEVYDVKTTDSRDSRTFEYPFIPRSAGDFTIGPVEYSYYDVSAGKYVTITSDPMPISVAKGKEAPDSGQTGGQLISNPARKDVKDLGSDIRFIRTEPAGLSPAGTFFVGSPLFWILTALILLLGAALWFAMRTIAARRADVVRTRGRSATKMARRRLSQSGEFLSKGLQTAFYEELHKALLGFVSDKLNMPVAELSRENISARLLDAGVSQQAVDSFAGLLDACEYARYAPDSGQEQMSVHYESAVNVISMIDDNMKNRRNNHTGAAALLILLLLTPIAGLRAQEPELLWQQGVSAYSEGRWADAAAAWEQILSSGQESPELYYNIGNAWFKGSEIARAILNYEKALKLDPSFSDARFNLEYASTLVQDRIESVPEFFLATWLRNFSHIMPSGAWAALFLVLLALAVALALLFLLARRTSLRRTGFFGGIVSLLLALVCVSFAFSLRSASLTKDSAIVMSSVASVKSSPGNGAATDLFVLHEGTRVRVLSEVGEWLNVELSDGRQGWLRSSDLQVF